MYRRKLVIPVSRKRLESDLEIARFPALQRARTIADNPPHFPQQQFVLRIIKLDRDISRANCPSPFVRYVAVQVRNFLVQHVLEGRHFQVFEINVRDIRLFRGAKRERLLRHWLRLAGETHGQIEAAEDQKDDDKSHCERNDEPAFVFLFQRVFSVKRRSSAAKKKF